MNGGKCDEATCRPKRQGKVWLNAQKRSDILIHVGR